MQRSISLLLILICSVLAQGALGMRQDILMPTSECKFPEFSATEDYVVLGAGSYSGRELEFQIDQSGHEATQIDVTVNAGLKPVVLMLGAYGPNIWNISWTRDSRVIAVVASGYRRQVVAGLPKNVPILVATFDNKSPCRYFFPSQEGNSMINPISRHLFGRPVSMFYPAKAGSVTVGDAVANSADLQTARDSPPEQFYDKRAPRAGRAGLEDALKAGLLRRATVADEDAWIKASAEVATPKDEPPIAGANQQRPRALIWDRDAAYVVLKPFTYPAGLYGGNAATFFIPKGVPAPVGSAGHSAVYDFNQLEKKKTRNPHESSPVKTKLPDNYPQLFEPDMSDPRLAAYVAWHRAVLADDFKTYVTLSACLSDAPEEQKRRVFRDLRQFAPEVVKITNVKEFPRGGIEFTAVGCKDQKRYVSGPMVIKKDDTWKVSCTGWGPPWNSSRDVCPL